MTHTTPQRRQADRNIFSQDALAALVKRTVPADRTNAVVGVVDDDGMSLVVKMTFRDRWEVEAAYRRDWQGNQSAGAKVIYSW